MLASHVAIDLNVLGVFMEDIIMSNVDSTTIVTIKRSGSGLWSIHVNQEPTKPDKLVGGVGKGTILNLGTRMGNHILLLTTPRDKRSTQQETKTCDKASISQITYLVCIWISMKLKRRLRGVVEIMIKCAPKISENQKNDNIVDKNDGHLWTY